MLQKSDPWGELPPQPKQAAFGAIHRSFLFKNDKGHILHYFQSVLGEAMTSVRE